MTTKAGATAPGTAWRNRIVGQGEEPPEQLLANPANWRVHPKEQQQALTGALSEVGWVAQVLVNRTTGHVVDGHLRVELAISRQESSVPVVYVELTEEDWPGIPWLEPRPAGLAAAMTWEAPGRSRSSTPLAMTSTGSSEKRSTDSSLRLPTGLVSPHTMTKWCRMAGARNGRWASKGSRW